MVNISKLWSKLTKSKRSFVKENSLEWLKPLEGEDPLLSDEQCMFVKQLCSQISSAAKLRKKVSGEEISKLKEDAKALKSNFHQVAEQVKKSGTCRKRFVDAYPEWESHRKSNIQNLKEIAKTLHKQHQNCRATKFISTLASLFGGGLSLVGGSGIIRLLGSIMMGLGSLVSTGTATVEEILLHENMGKVTGVMQQDKKCMEDLILHLRDANALQETLKCMKSANYEENFKGAVEKFHSISKRNLTQKEVKKAIKNVMDDYNLRFYDEISDVIGILVTTFMLVDRNYFVFEFAFKSYDVVSKLGLAVDLFRGAYTGVNAIGIACKSDALTNAQKTKIASGMALDAARMLIIALQDEKSTEAEIITKVADQLEAEINEFKTLYEGMKSSGIQRNLKQIIFKH